VAGNVLYGCQGFPRSEQSRRGRASCRYWTVSYNYGLLLAEGTGCPSLYRPTPFIRRPSQRQDYQPVSRQPALSGLLILASHHGAAIVEAASKALRLQIKMPFSFN